ncbi:Riboflavin biosynthesis protein RibF [Candidatus Profftia lariciata]|uniref:bifunctional riboflavin kinase/FAD synthetase n=1 Tax=Candidatus Profftia lariciata TaxID=1987921 RepID=UPI001D0186BD|nr:bifunctional riboflavin kinase/FAD synthetase [Candidatus Profftia lariciata]UDG81763.1 Riboflavin biosynthesis protein RibF [Candidatus Profftia lariciata]
MELIRDIYNLRARHNSCILTIGNFDGVHRGHQKLLTSLTQEGKRLGLPVMVMSFEPHALEFFRANKAPARLTQLRDKCYYLANAKIDYFLCIRFNHFFAAISANTFLKKVLVEKIGIKYLIIGDDFRFGAKRQGDYKLLKQSGYKFGFTVTNSTSFCTGNQRISSTAIRQALQADNLNLAEKMLGHPYSISGRVIHGDKIGRTIGFPTANLALKWLIAPVKGVYIVDVYGLTAKPLPGVANIGIRPTISGRHQQLDVHLLDITINIYGRYINVVLRAKLRDEKKFISLDALKQQIANDVVMARAFFKLDTSV